MLNKPPSVSEINDETLFISEQTSSQTDRYHLLKCECSELKQILGLDLNPDKIIDYHIKKLKEYNELRDTALKLIAIIADEKGCLVTEILEEMSVELEDL